MERVLAQFEEITPVATATPGAAAWTAREAGTGRRVLIKRLAGEEAKTRATQALALRHARIVPTRRWLRDESGFYVVRDFITGRNARQALGAAAHRAFDRLQSLFSPLIDALEYAHQLGLPHGGVTPENVLVSGVDGPLGPALICDWATSLVTPKDYVIPPTAHTDFAAICELYKEFLPTRPHDDEAGQAARARLLRNLTEIQRTAQNGEELRFKLDAIGRMAELLGFSSDTPQDDMARQGARIVCAVSPPTAIVNPGGGAAVALTLRNEGDLPLHIETIGSDVVWLNPATRFTPVTLAPDAGRDVMFALSGARLKPGSYQAHLLVRSNSGMTTLMPTAGTAWHEQVVTLPVLVKGSTAPLADRLPPPSDDIAETYIGERPPLEVDPDRSGIACTQEPDPGLVRYGQNGVLHLGVQNVGPRRLRVDRLSTWPPWLIYPGDWQPLWIEPGATQYFGFSVQAGSLTGGDYKAEVTLMTSSEEPTLLGSETVWREMKCNVRVRVVRGAGDEKLDAKKLGAGCLPLLLAVGASLAGLAALVIR